MLTFPLKFKYDNDSAFVSEDLSMLDNMISFIFL